MRFRTSVNIARAIRSVSSRCSKRSFSGGKRTPYASCSASNQAAPMPNHARPPEMTSSVVHILASKAGLR